MNVIRVNKFIHEMLPTAMTCQSKAPKVLMQSDMPFGLARRRALLSVQYRQMNFKHTTVRHQSTKFAPLCGLNYRSQDIEIFRAQTGSARNGWKFLVAKWTDIAQ